MPEGTAALNDPVEIGAQEGSVETDTFMLALDLIEQPRRHCGQAAQLVSRSSEKLDRYDAPHIIVSPREPFENLAGPAVAIDRFGRLAAFNRAEYMRSMEQAARIL